MQVHMRLHKVNLASTQRKYLSSRNTLSHILEAEVACTEMLQVYGNPIDELTSEALYLATSLKACFEYFFCFLWAHANIWHRNRFLCFDSPNFVAHSQKNCLARFWRVVISLSQMHQILNIMLKPETFFYIHFLSNSRFSRSDASHKRPVCCRECLHNLRCRQCLLENLPAWAMRQNLSMAVLTKT